MILTKGLQISAKNHARQMAIVGGDIRLTYQQFADRVSQLKQALLHQGIGKGDPVALLLFNDFRYLELFYAVTAIGAIVIPLNTRLTLPEVIELLQDSEPKALFFHREFSGWVQQIARKILSLQSFVLAEKNKEEGPDYVRLYEDLISEWQPQPLTFDRVEPDDVAGLFYTGGTTGRSKGVMLTHANLVSNAYHAAIMFRFDQGTRYLHAGPMFHLADGACTFAVTLVGGTHYHLRTFHPQAFLKLVDQEKPNAVLLVPTMVNMLVNEPALNQYDPKSIQTLIYGGSPMPVEVLKKVKSVWPHAQFIQGYGMTEASPLVTMLLGKDHIIGGTEKEEKRLSSAGQAIVGVQVKIVDPDGNETKIGEVGELIVQGPNVMKGYWNRPEETAAALRGGWYYTGDMAYRDEDHYFYVVDRKKDMIVTGGENVYSVEVEQSLYTHPDVREAVVIGVPDPVWGEVVKAIVVKKEKSSLTGKNLIDYARQRLAGFKVPKSVDFVTELPKSGAGKILKRKLREPYWESYDKRVN
ncbi:class I adenylate-forming enzyme family protein [Paenactinomyces guangxiensis]|uniref:Long-chain fatty acid--CoA ligase n=1 Tax=Paenactinomyces guangxiensis TaxID=1490290 RepID=A0A7W2AAH0_9BACL|nr:long-chain fatty acid--CoA ligase [Paenactinomyces guangxiensis]MBA4496262.1 long-chain fatty acid--CoA ligase [Paenactinomyces guangxiensis]MBH8593356.1 long-chain fatty acid--CoA ligase [Paenactinomyces guangxiensis]